MRLGVNLPGPFFVVGGGGRRRRPVKASPTAKHRWLIMPGVPKILAGHPGFLMQALVGGPWAVWFFLCMAWNIVVIALFPIVFPFAWAVRKLSHRGRAVQVPVPVTEDGTPEWFTRTNAYREAHDRTDVGFPG